MRERIGEGQKGDEGLVWAATHTVNINFFRRYFDPISHPILGRLDRPSMTVASQGQDLTLPASTASGNQGKGRTVGPISLGDERVGGESAGVGPGR
jgi:hypothetical protein